MPSSPLTYSVRARATAAGSAEIDLADQTMRVDNSWGGEPTGLPGPAELLAASFTACLLKNLARASQLLDFEYERAEVDVTARREDGSTMSPGTMSAASIRSAAPARLTCACRTCSRRSPSTSRAARSSCTNPRTTSTRIATMMATASIHRPSTAANPADATRSSTITLPNWRASTRHQGSGRRIGIVFGPECDRRAAASPGVSPSIDDSSARNASAAERECHGRRGVVVIVPR